MHGSLASTYGNHARPSCTTQAPFSQALRPQTARVHASVARILYLCGHHHAFDAAAHVHVHMHPKRFKPIATNHADWVAANDVDDRDESDQAGTSSKVTPKSRLLSRASLHHDQEVAMGLADMHGHKDLSGAERRATAGAPSSAARAKARARAIPRAHSKAHLPPTASDADRHTRRVCVQNYINASFGYDFCVSF